MAVGLPEFRIDDALSTQQNLDSYIEILRKIDPVLAAALGPQLAVMVTDKFNPGEVWKALSAATDSPVPAEQEQRSNNAGNGT